MKKILYTGIALQLLLTGIIFLSLMNQVKLTNLLYKGQERFTLLADEKKSSLSLTEQAGLLAQIAEKNQVNVHKYIYQDDKNLTIYTTDMALGKQIHYNKEFTETKTSRHSSKDFIWNDPQLKLTIHSLTESGKTGISGLYYISYSEKEALENFIQEVSEKLGMASHQQTNDYYYRLLSELFANYFLLLVWLLLGLVNISIQAQFLLRTREKIIILAFFGWKKREILQLLMGSTIRFIGSVSLIFCLISYSYFFIRDGGFPAMKVLFLIFLFVFCLIVGISGLIHWLFLFQNRRDLVSEFKGKSFAKFGITAHFVLRFFAALLILGSVLQVFALNGQLETLQKQSHDWEQTQNIYGIQLRFITNDTKKYRAYEENLYKFFIEAEKKHQLFLMDASNYEKLSSGEYSYQANTQNSLEEIVSSFGRSITINRNYLDMHTIKKENGQRVDPKEIIAQKDTRWLLVPVKYRVHEAEIKKYHEEGFLFQKNAVREKDTIESTSAVVQIIYVEDNQSYFAYNESFAATRFAIEDPITVVDTGQVDASFYASWLTGQSFIKSAKMTGYEEIYPTVLATNTLPSIQNTVSIYNQRGEIINQLNSLLKTLFLLLFVLGVVLIGTIYFSNQLFIQQNIYRFYLKKIFGYSYIELIRQYIFFQVMLNLMVAILVLFMTPTLLAIYVIFGWLLIDATIMWSSLFYTRRIIDGFSLSKKGEQT